MILKSPLATTCIGEHIPRTGICDALKYAARTLLHVRPNYATLTAERDEASIYCEDDTAEGAV